MDPECKKYLERFPNVRFLNMTTQEATALLKREGKHFDFALVDADHSTEGVYRDTTDAMSLADVIIFHDSYRPECRRGIKKAVAGRDVYCDLDFVPGCLQSNGLWGGLGLIFPALSHNERYNYDPRVSAYPYLALQSLLRNPLSISQVSKIYDLLKRIDRRLERTVAILREKW